jgi:hypothetical protein
MGGSIGIGMMSGMAGITNAMQDQQSRKFEAQIKAFDKEMERQLATDTYAAFTNGVGAKEAATTYDQIMNARLDLIDPQRILKPRQNTILPSPANNPEIEPDGLMPGRPISFED